MPLASVMTRLPYLRASLWTTAARNAKFEILWNLISAVVQSVGGVILLWHAFEFGASMQAQEGGGAITRSLKGVGGALVMLVAPVITTALKG